MLCQVQMRRGKMKCSAGVVDGRIFYLVKISFAFRVRSGICRWLLLRVHQQRLNHFSCASAVRFCLTLIMQHVYAAMVRNEGRSFAYFAVSATENASSNNANISLRFMERRHALR